MSNKSEQVKIYQKSSGGVILKNGEVMPSNMIARELNGMKEQMRKLTLKNKALQSMNEDLGADIARLLVGGNKSTRSTLPDGVTRVVDAATGSIGIDRVFEDLYVRGWNACVESCRGAQLGAEVIYRCSYCQTVYFDTDHHCECLPHGAKPEFSRWVMTPAPTPPASAEPVAWIRMKNNEIEWGEDCINGIKADLWCDDENGEYSAPLYFRTPASAEGLDKVALLADMREELEHAQHFGFYANEAIIKQYIDGIGSGQFDIKQGGDL